MESRQRTSSVDQSLDHLWHQFVSSQNHREKLSEYLQSFIQSYSTLIDVDFSCLEAQRSAVNSHCEVLIPDELLPTLKYRVLAYVEEKLNDELQIQDVNLLLQVLIILSRNSKTMELVASSDFIKPVLMIFEAVLNKTWSSEMSSRQQLLSFTRFALLYLECLYDPNFNWRLSLQKLPQKKKKDDSCSAVGLDLHIVPFIYECLHRSHIDSGIQLQLLHLYGAIISGSRTNSVTAICPATVDILMRVLQGLSSRPSSDVTHMTSVILKCVVATVHAVHCAIPEERQVEVGAILEMYYQVLLQFCDNDRNISLQLAMLDAVEAMFSTVDKSSMQNAFMASGICRHLLIFIRSIKKWPSYSHTLSTAAVRVFGFVLSDSTTAKEKFIQTVGYENVFEALKELGQPTRDLLTSLLEMVCEKRLDDGSRLSVRNSRVVILLIKWLPDIDPELQSWLSSTLYQICTANTGSLNQCCNDGINAAILDCLSIWNELDTKTVGDLLDLIEATGSQFIWQNDLKKLLQLFKSDSGKHLEMWMEKRLLKAMSKMAESDNKQIPATYFQFNSCDHGIKATNLGRWSGSGFSFHAWICLENPPSFPDDFRMARRQLYMIQTSSGSGFEAFFTHEAVLVISVFSKKERNDIPVMDCPIVCNKWYCIDVVHASSKRPFGQSQLSVYVDEVLHVSANLKFPALGDEVVVCKIGCGSGEVGSPWIRVKSNGIQATSDVTAHEAKSLPSVGDFASSKSSSSSSSSGFWSRLSFRPGSRATRLPSDSNDGGDGADVRHGTVVSLFGCLSEVVVFTEALLDTQVQSLFRLGPNRYLNQLKDGAVPPELPAKPLFAYHAKASFRETCWDLSGNGHHAKVAGQLCTASNIRDVIHTIGGVQLLYFLLEEAAVLSSGFSEVDLINFSKENRQSRSAIDSLEPFFLLLRSLVQNCPMNQDALLHNDGIAALGAILQKASSSLLDNKFHESLKGFVKSLPCSPDDAKLLHEVYQHLIFDFRIWSNCSLQVCLGHIQYLQLIIKEDRKYFRKKYGVQYVLDAVRMCFGSTSSGHLTAEQKEEIRAELLKIILFYVSREINATELSQILAFISAVQDEVLISEVLGIIKSLLVERGKRDQIYLLLFEPGMADMLYVLLTVKDYSVELKEKIFQIVALLLKTDRVYERNKSRLRLVDSNLFPGLVSLMVETQPSVQMTKHMLEQVFIAESSASINAAIYIIQTLYLCDVDVKLEAVRQLMKVLLSKPTIPKLFAKQIGWQIALIRLFIRRPSSTSASKWRSSFDEAETRPVVQRAESVSDDPPERLIEIPRDDDTTLDFQSEEDDVPNKFLMSSEFDPYAVPDGRTVRRGSISSCPDATDDGGLSLRGPSRSPSTFSSLSLGCENQAKTLVKDGCEGKAVMIALKELGLNGLPNTENMERTEELCLNLLIVLFLIIWKGFDQADETAWQERGEVFAAIAYTSEDNELLISKTELTQKLLELLLQGCLIDVQDSGISNPNNTKNSVNVMKLLYKFLCLDDGAGPLKFSKQLLEDLMILLEDFSVWQTGNDWKEMEQMALRCLLAFAAQENSDLCGIASARLHAMIRDRPVEKFQESCFLVGVINDILNKSQDGTGDQYGFLIQVMKSLLEKCEDLLNIPSYLPSLPIIRSSRSFIEAFKTYSRSEEWTAFIKRQVEPSKDQYLVNIYEGLRIRLTAYMGECHEEMMVAGHKRNREKGEAKLKFEEEFVATFKNSARQENKRFKSVRLQLRNQNMAAWNQWTLTRSFFLSERGLWPDKNLHSMHWKLSLYENYSRMRPKLIPNEKFDQHLEASRLRDNEACEEELSSAVSTLSLIADVKVKGSAGDDRLEDDEWNLISANASTNEHLSTKETILTEECELVTIMEVIKGRLDVTSTHIYFFDCTPLREDGGIVDLKWSLDEIKEIHFRRHNLRRSALEFFLVDQTNYFINFQKKVRNKVYSRILSLRPPNLIYNQSRSPAELLKSSGLTQKWIQREIDNFDYLMCLNTIAGRTYNDLSQYPVFPWVLSDYKSETLDLNNPQSYRDLSRPIGVVNPKNEIQVQEKYEHFEDPTGTVAKFHYGTHYSNPAGVMHYLIRMEPFTTLHIQLQSGRFDVADRQFNSIPAMWEGLMDNPNDVKELIPEFFYLPEFLINMNDFDLGKLQFGDGKVDDVILPPWASTPYEFIHKHRLALESDYVSDHLHEWIDLIFGYKQQGTAAAEALNVFYYCTYEGAVDLESVTDEKKRRAFEGMINNFGQTPCQLLKEPHPKRMSLQEIVTRTTKPERPLKVFTFAEKLNTFSVEAAPQNDHLAFVAIPRSQTTSFISHWTTESLIAITESGAVYSHGWLPYDKNIPGFFTFERDPSINNVKTRKKLPGPMMPGLNVTSKMFALSHDAKLLFSCGHWDNSLRVYSVARNKQLAHIVRHRDIVTCVSLDHSSRHLISGSRDTTCMIWEILHQGSSSCNINPRPVHVLYGHNDQITCVAIATELDMAVSGSEDGTVIVHTVKDGMYLRTLRPPYEKGWQLSIRLLALSDVGQICVYCQHSSRGPMAAHELDKLSLHLYSVNGKHLTRETLETAIADMVISADHLVLGSISGHLIIKQLYGLRLLSTVHLHQAVTCVAVANEGSRILCALADSSLIVVAVKRC